MANWGYPVLGSNAAVASASGVTALAKRGLLEKSRNYKFWVLAALLLLAFWSMLISSVTLRRSIGTLATGDSPDPASYEDLDILEIEEREKVVRHMWDVYTHSKIIRLPRFWQDAFRAGYESLARDALGLGMPRSPRSPRCPCGALSPIPLLFRTRLKFAVPSCGATIGLLFFVCLIAMLFSNDSPAVKQKLFTGS